MAVIGEGLVELNLHTDHRRADLAPGGDAGNIAVMAAQLGQAVSIAGRVGKDPLGTLLRRFWRDAGVDTSHVSADPDATTGLYINTPRREGGHRFHYWRASSAGSHLQHSDLTPALFDDLELLVITGITLAVSESSARAAARAAEQARTAGAMVAVVLNHRPILGADPSRLADAARNADIVIGSTEDTAAVYGQTDPAALADGPLRACELVLTRGPDPATVTTRDGLTHSQAVPPMPAVNAAGAGDALAGAYLARRLAHDPPREALTWGVAASALSVTRAGCALSYPTREQTASLVTDLLLAA